MIESIENVYSKSLLAIIYRLISIGRDDIILKSIETIRLRKGRREREIIDLFGFKRASSNPLNN